MVLKQQLHQKQIQKLILAPALQQAIKLLPLTHLELLEIIDAELSQNPMLEIQEEVVTKKDDEMQTDDKEDWGEKTDKEKSITEDDRSSERDEVIEEREFESYFQEYVDEGFPSLSFEKKESPALENFISKTVSLWDHLEWQVNLTFFEKKEREIAQYIVGNINEDGYLTVSIEEIGEKMDASLGEVEAVRSEIKRFDPIGVGSLSLKECLIAQMDHIELEDKTARKIVELYLPLLERSDYSQLSKKLGVPLSDIKAIIEIIRRLDPAPGSKYSLEKTYYVVPDIIVTNEEGKLQISLNDDGMPRLRINRFYRKMLAQAAQKDPEACRFLKDRMKKAFWFLRSLDQRKNTIYKVAKYIVERQKDFIDKGLEYIKPLTLVELAQEIGVHESTIGRVVANKHMMTPRGVFSLKYFFHKSLIGDYGEEISSLRVKEKIKKLLETENKENPFSDIEIEHILARENFKIARRTVAKYRKQLSIPPSHIRKRKYWMEETG